MIGGATTSKIHTAVKIEPNYSGTTVHVLDASQSVGVVSNLLSKEKSEAYISKLKDEYENLRTKHKDAKPKTIIPFAKATANKLQLDWNNFTPVVPNKLGVEVFEAYPLDEIANYIDWTFFFHAWELNGVYPKILSHPEKGEEATNLFNDAQKMLAQIIDEKWLQANAVYGLFPANTVEDNTIALYNPAKTDSVIAKLPQLRQQTELEANISLADYIAPESSQKTDYLGLFAVTSGIGIDARVKAFEAAGDDYSAIMIKTLADRLAEAFAELLHKRIRTEFWGYATDENISAEEMHKGKFQGIRPAYGYPACPEHSVKRTIFDLLDCENNAGVSLTEHFAMLPTASVSGMYFAHPDTKYFGVGKIGKDQMEAYASARGIAVENIEKLISPNLGY